VTQFLVCVRFVGPSSIEKETFFDNSDLKWEKLVCICTDGTPAILGSRSGLLASINEKSPFAFGSHCAIRESLAAGTLSSTMKDKLAIIIRAINFVKTSAVSNTRLCDMRAKTLIPIMRLCCFSYLFVVYQKALACVSPRV